MFIQLNTVERNMLWWCEKGIRLMLKSPWKYIFAHCKNESQNLSAWSQNLLAPGLLYQTNKVCYVNNVQ